jgi:hypothetical protein
MRTVLALTLIFSMQSAFSQKLTINALEAILHSSFTSADSVLKRSGFKLADKESAQGYSNYYYTSLERVENAPQLLRTLSFMDVYDGADTSRLLLYRTYYKNDQDEMTRQLLSSGYELLKRSGNDFIYKKGDYTLTNKISDKNGPAGKPVTAYEFELGR